MSNDTVKIFHPDDQEGLLERFGSLVNVVDSYSGIKKASETGIPADIIEQHKPDKDHFMLHVVAMGDDEHYGRNKNLDAWPGVELDEKHGTFVTHGHFYREHRHRRKDQRIGSIVHSHRDKQKGWVELLIHGALKPREGEPLTAEAEYERARQGKNVDVSMSAAIHYDQCSCCGHKAPHPKHWCEHMRRTPGRWVPEFKKFAYVTNKVKRFFDISSVANRADRIARFMGYYFPDGDTITKKLASEGAVLNGAELAEAYGIDPSDYAEPAYKSAAVYLAKEAATLLQASTPQQEAVNNAIAYHKVASLNAKEREAMSATRPAALMRKMASKGVILSLPDFLNVFGGDSGEDDILGRAMELTKSVAGIVPSEMSGVFDMCGNSTAGIGTDGIDELMHGVADRLGMLSGPAIVRRTANVPPKGTVTTITISLSPVKEAKAKAWAELYNAYKSASVEHIQQLHGTGCLDGLPAVIIANL